METPPKKGDTGELPFIRLCMIFQKHSGNCTLPLRRQKVCQKLWRFGKDTEIQTARIDGNDFCQLVLSFRSFWRIGGFGGLGALEDWLMESKLWAPKKKRLKINGVSHGALVLQSYLFRRYKKTLETCPKYTLRRVFCEHFRVGL